MLPPSRPCPEGSCYPTLRTLMHTPAHMCMHTRAPLSPLLEDIFGAATPLWVQRRGSLGWGVRELGGAERGPQRLVHLEAGMCPCLDKGPLHMHQGKISGDVILRSPCDPKSCDRVLYKRRQWAFGDREGGGKGGERRWRCRTEGWASTPRNTGASRESAQGSSPPAPVAGAPGVWTGAGRSPGSGFSGCHGWPARTLLPP